MFQKELLGFSAQNTSRFNSDFWQKEYMGLLILGAGYLLTTYWLHAKNTYESGYGQGAFGAYYQYNLMRIVFFAYFVWMVQALGGLLLKKIQTRDSLDWFLLKSFTGAATLILLMFVLGFLKLFYFSTAFGISILILFFAREEARQSLSQLNAWILETWDQIRKPHDFFSSRIKRLPVYVFAGIAVYELFLIFVSKGLFPDLGSDPFGHYLPYYREVLRTHSLWMNPYFYHYFYSKGAGLQFFSMLLTDVQSFQLTTFYFFLLGSLLLFQLIKRLTNSNVLYAWTAVILYGASQIHTAEFQKLHTTNSSMIFAILYWGGYILTESGKKSSWPIFPLFIISAALTVMSPLSFAFTCPFLLFFMFMAWTQGKRDVAKKFATVWGVATAAFVGILGWNYLTSGMAEITPQGFFFEHRDDHTLRRWVDPISILGQIVYNSGESRIDLSRLTQIDIETRIRGLYDPALLSMSTHELVLGLGLLAAIFLLFSIGKKSFKSLTFNLLVPAVFLVCYVQSLEAAVIQESFGRYTIFLIPIRVSFFVLGFYAVMTVFRRLLTQNKNPFWAQAIAVIFCGICSWHSLQVFWSFKPQERISFLQGKQSYQDAYLTAFFEDAPACLNLGQYPPPDAKVLLLNFSPGCYGIPGTRFQRPFMAEYNLRMSEALFGTAEVAAKALKEMGVHYFSVRFNKPFLFQAYAPLFEPENIKKYFKIRNVYPGLTENDHQFLLTWKSEGEKEIDEGEWIQSYSKWRESYRNHPYSRTYERLKETHFTGK